MGCEPTGSRLRYGLKCRSNVPALIQNLTYSFQTGLTFASRLEIPF